MEISFSRFAQLTAMIAAGGTLVSACTVNNVHEDTGTGGATGTVNPATGGATSAAGSSSLPTTATGGSSASTSALTTGGTTSATSAQAGSTSTGGATGVGGVTGTVTSSAATGGAGGADATSTGTNTATGGAGGVATTLANSDATGGTTTTASTGTQIVAMGGTTTVASTTAGGATAVTTDTNPDAGTTDCVSGEPAAEGYGYNCSNLAFYTESCPDPTGEGDFSYGAKWCNVYAAERVDAVKVFTDCLQNLTVPTTGWCGAEQKAAVDACRNQMLAQTCPSTAAQEACANINAACTAISVADCVADLSPLSDATIATIEPCMEGALASDCEAMYRSCAKFPDQVLSVATTCEQLQQTCSELDLTTCQTALDSYGTGSISYYLYETLLSTCIEVAVAADLPCAEAFTTCTINW